MIKHKQRYEREEQEQAINERLRQMNMMANN
jgi:hypothetical protein